MLMASGAQLAPCRLNYFASTISVVDVAKLLRSDAGTDGAPPFGPRVTGERISSLTSGGTCRERPMPIDPG
jgi:hypothetical protein